MANTDVVTELQKYVGETIKWKNSEHSGYREVALGTATDFSFASTGLCCFDIILFAAFNAGKIDKAELKQIYQGIVAGKFNAPAPLVSGTIYQIGRAEVGTGNVLGSDVVNTWPASGDIVFFRRKGVVGTMLDHVALACGGDQIVTFGEDVVKTAAQQNLTQAQLNQDGLNQVVQQRGIPAVYQLFEGMVHFAKPRWDGR